MGSFSFENQGANTYLVYELGVGEELDSMALGMLTNNEIPGLAQAMFTQIDTAKLIKYNVSAKVSAAQLFSGSVNRVRLLGVFSGIVGALLSAEDYMLEADSLLLDMNYIFADVSTCKTVMVCLPVTKKAQSAPTPSAFFKSIIFNTQFDQTENCDYVAQILNYLNSNPVVALADFKRLLDRLKAAGGQSMRPAAQPQPSAMPYAQAAAPVRPTAPAQPAAPVRQPSAPNARPAAPSGQPSVPVRQSPAMPPMAGGQTPAKKFDNLQFGSNYTPTGQPTARGANPYGAPPARQAPSAPQTPSMPNAASAETEKPMSMFYLLQHYNKDNAAVYKARKETKKAAKKGEAVLPTMPPQQRPKQQPQPNAGFAVPSRTEAPAGFAVPGRTEAPAGGFAVPNKPQVPASYATPPVPQRPQPVPQAPVGRQAPMPRQAQPPVQKPAPMSPPVYPQTAGAAAAISFGETTVLGGTIGETTVLSTTMEPNKIQPHLIRMKNNEKIPLNKPVFRIGKERSYVDYFISDNTAISRSHANIINRDGEFFIVDTNSTNHTYVNGGMIQSNVETKLSNGTEIRLANEDFEFKLY